MFEMCSAFGESWYLTKWWIHSAYFRVESLNSARDIAQLRQLGIYRLAGSCLLHTMQTPSRPYMMTDS